MSDIKIIIPNAAQIDAQNAILTRMANKMGAYEEPLIWDAFQAAVRAGIIRQYADPGDPLEVDTNITLTATATGEGITAATVDRDTFLAIAGTHAHDYEFAFNGHAWHYGGRAVTLSDYGLGVTGTPVDGDTILVHRSATTWDYDVQGIDEDEPVNPNIKHVVSLQSHKIMMMCPFDPAQYLFPVTAESLAWLGITGDVLPAGTYNVTLDHGTHTGSTVEDGTYQFAITVPVPIGGGIRHSYMGSWKQNANDYSKANVLAGTFLTYGADTTTTLESGIATTEGANGKSLGTATAYNPAYKVGDYINYTQRQIHGAGRWSTSYVRQVLNSDDAELAWMPATIWSRNDSTKREGFLHMLDPELRAVLCKVRTRYALSIADGYGYEDVEDYVKLDTMLDIFGSKNNNIVEGPVDADGNVTRQTAYTMWRELDTDADRIKYQGTTARYWWLASTRPSSADFERYVSPSGALHSGLANDVSGVAPSLYIG